MKAPEPDAKPWGWIIEFPAGNERHVSFIAHSDDYAYVMAYAVRLHGEVLVIPERPPQ